MAQAMYATQNKTGVRFEVSVSMIGSGSVRFEENNVTSTKALGHDCSFHEDYDTHTMQSLYGCKLTSPWEISKHPSELLPESTIL